MPSSSWTTPTLSTVRQQNRDYVTGKLGYQLLANSPEAVLSDAAGGNAHLNLQYLDWQANQLLPDTCEKQFLDRWATIFLVNADGSRGRKLATFASGAALVTATAITVLPAGSIFQAGNAAYQTAVAITLGVGLNMVALRALNAGAVGNLAVGAPLSLAVAVAGVSGSAGMAVVTMTGGSDEESDDELRVRVLARIRQPPMGGDADDYVAWALNVEGVTRAWCSPLEMGMGTVTLRFMCDDLRASAGGIPSAADIAAMTSYIDLVRPVAIKDRFIVAPTLYPVNFAIQNLVGDSIALRAAIANGVSAMLARRASPAFAFNGIRQPATNIPSAWVDAAVYAAVGGVAYDLLMQDAVMPNAGSLAVLGTIG